jgi:hypothetical protein
MPEEIAHEVEHMMESVALPAAVALRRRYAIVWR